MESPEKKLKVLVVDDEFHARKLLCDYVLKLPLLELIASAANAFEAITVLQKHSVDILFLDIHMPDVTGLEFARSLRKAPAIIFTTAYSDYAVESYEIEAVDYLLKPIAFPRFIQAVNKVYEKKYPAHLSIVNPAGNDLFLPGGKEYIIVKDGSKMYRVQYADLIYMEGQREYVTFYTTKQRITALYTMKKLEEELPKTDFIRIHKSFIVSLKKIEMIDKNTLHIHQKQLPIGGSYKEELLRMINEE